MKNNSPAINTTQSREWTDKKCRNMQKYVKLECSDGA